MEIDTLTVLSTVATSVGNSALFAPGAFSHAGWGVATLGLLFFLTCSVVSLKSFLYLQNVFAIFEKHALAGSFKVLPTGRRRKGGAGPRSSSPSAFDDVSGEDFSSSNDRVTSLVNSKSVDFASVQLSNLQFYPAIDDEEAYRSSLSRKGSRSAAAGMFGGTPLSASSSSNAPAPVFEARTLIHFFLGAFWGYLYDISVISNFFVALLLKVAQVIDISHILFQTFMPVQHASQSDVDDGMLNVAASMISMVGDSKEGVAIAVWIFLTLLNAVRVSAFKAYQRVCDLMVLLGHITLIVLLIRLLMYSAELSSTFEEHTAHLARSAAKRSSTLFVIERCERALIAFSASFLPHVVTPVFFRVGGAGRGYRGHFYLLVSVAVYSLLMGALGDSALAPTGKKSPRLVLFNFVENHLWTEWVPSSGAQLLVPLVLTVPFFHLGSVGRGLSAVVAGSVQRLFLGSEAGSEQRRAGGSAPPRFIFSPKAVFWLQSIIFFIAANFAANSHLKLGWVMLLSASANHVLYLLAHLRAVGSRLVGRVVQAEQKVQLNLERRSSVFSTGSGDSERTPLISGGGGAMYRPLSCRGATFGGGDVDHHGGEMESSGFGTPKALSRRGSERISSQRSLNALRRLSSGVSDGSPFQATSSSAMFGEFVDVDVTDDAPNKPMSSPRRALVSAKLWWQRPATIPFCVLVAWLVVMIFVSS